MSNCYLRTISQIGLSESQQNMSGLTYLMLKMLGDYEDANPTADTYTNPGKECLYRLRAYQNTDGYNTLSHLLGARAENASVSPFQSI